ncbi:Rpn family recombination-promoting nuclease/putative transposase [Candidatus Orientia mediorientalis]
MDLNSIRLEKDSYVEETIRRSMCDVLLLAETKNDEEEFIYFLIEV